MLKLIKKLLKRLVNRVNYVGFTLVELMIVVAIVGILAGIAIPRYQNFIRRSREGATKGNLGAIRSALTMYYSNVEGYYPARDTAIAGVTGLEAAPFIGIGTDNYLDEIVPAKEDCGIHSPSVAGASDVKGYAYGVNGAEDGGWAYFTDSSDNVKSARIEVNCAQPDTKNITISQW